MQIRILVFHHNANHNFPLYVAMKVHEQLRYLLSLLTRREVIILNQ